MPVQQYVYFALHSERTTAREMAERLDLEPDETSVRGSRMSEPRILPVSHIWKLVCREPGLRVDEQVDCVMSRLLPHADRVAALVESLDAREGGRSGPTLEVVRYIDAGPPSGPAPSASPSLDLFGWWLDPAVVQFLARVGAGLDVDEYDLTADGEP